MGFDELGLAIMNTEAELKTELGALLQGQLDGDRMLQVAQMFRRLGCGSLLMELDVEDFARSLYCGAKVYLELLQACERGQLETYYQWRSHASPLLDAIAIGAFDLAREISEASADECFMAQGEAEEDHYYYRLLSVLLANPVVRDRWEPLLAAFEQSLQGDSSSRHDVVVALCNADPAAFAEAFRTFLEEWQEEMSQLREGTQLDVYDKPTTANICIEGLALLRLARAGGIQTEDEYPHIPDVAIAMDVREFPEAFSVLSS